VRSNLSFDGVDTLDYHPSLMSVRPLQRITLTACVLAMVGLCHAQEGQQQKPASAPAPAAAKGATQAARPQQNGLKNLESDLFKPFKTAAPESSLDAVMPPPAQSPQTRPQDERRIREKRQRDKDWVFTDPNEAKESQSFEEMLKLPGSDKNSKEQKKLSPVEQYYRRVLGFDSANHDPLGGGDDRKKAGKKPLYDTKLPGTTGSADEEDDANLSPGLRETKRSLKALTDDRLERKDNSTWNGKGFFTDVFGLGQQHLPTAEEIAAKRLHDEQMNDFRKILGVPKVALPADSFDPLAGLRSPAPSAGSSVSLPSISTAIKAPAPNVQLGAIGGSIAPAFTAPQNTSLPSLGAAPAPLVVDQPRRLLPKSPDFTPPQRRF